tara:strand:- start:5870 stop:7474 length:1605 start_codon:yes stop_codon:yes gene_type:complete
LTSLIVGGEIAIYSEWQSKLNFKAVSHLFNPNEVFDTATIKHFFIMGISILIGLFFVKFYKYLFFVKFYKSKIHNIFLNKSLDIKLVIFKIIRIPIILSLFLLLIRGGVQPIPINLSDSYFSKHMIINDLSVNPNWNLLQSMLKNSRNFNGNPYQKHSSSDVNTFINKLSFENQSTSKVLKNNKPNIVFILLESWSADNIESLNGLSGITPHFKSLEDNGLLFSNFYSNGWTSDQAMTSIYSSFPVFPYLAIINQTDKSRMLPCINKSLKEKGYHSSYFFGGQLSYGNIKSYLYAHGFDIIKEEKNYNNLPSGKLGIHDEYMFDIFHSELNKLPEPFMSTLFTLSSHSPYDFPAEHLISFDHRQDKYVNSVNYTDKCLGNFMKKVKDESWYKNTLFIIVADHSHNSPIYRRLAQKERFKIPMLWYGDVLKDKYKARKMNRLGSHIDISSTLLGQLNIDYSEFKFSTNLFNRSSYLVPYAFPKGYGIIRQKGYYAFSEGYKKVIENHAKTKKDKTKQKKEAEMYFQNAFDSYINY